MNAATAMIARLAPMACLALAGAAAMAAPPTRLAWLQGEQWHAVQRTSDHTESLSQAPRTPLGSVWKLFVFGYLHGRSVQEPEYQCPAAAPRLAEEDYCCEPGSGVGRDQALARSCGPYFEPRRLALAADDWSRFWREQQAPAWLLRLEAMRPDTTVPVPELLQALRRMPAATRLAARRALLPVATGDEGVLASLGSGPRYKTWSWRIDGAAAGGAAGWLADGTPFWLGSAGSSRSALRTQAAWMAAQWPAHGLAAPQPDAAAVEAQPCVEVDFFQRYPIRSVQRLDGSPAAAGAMSGPYRITFHNGRQLRIEATPSMQLRPDASGATLHAQLPLEDYVARVVDREGRGDATEAARALAVAARSYVLQNAPEAQACRRIADDSRTQRVSPNPPSEAARAAAAFTEDLVVRGVAVRYHLDQAQPGVLSWQAALAAGRRGQGFIDILRSAYPGAGLGSASAETDCEPLPQARQWLVQRQQRWREQLRTQAGFQPLESGLQVCRLTMGMPHSDQRRLLIRVRDWQSREGRVSLIHEYLHLAFRHHPNGRDEAFVEQLAQRLADS